MFRQVIKKQVGLDNAETFTGSLQDSWGTLRCWVEDATLSVCLTVVSV